MRAQEFLLEYQQGLVKVLQGWFPDWPDYVIRDMLYPAVKGLNQDEIEDYAMDVAENYPVNTWRLQTLNLGFHSFDSETQRKILAREGGTRNPMAVPRDAERHNVQAQQIQQTGAPSQEPIIVIQRPGVDGLELVEGWHRTIQNLRAFPNGYRARAWVGYT
jgi:hypothetical protein